jgi:carbon storage regulator
MLIITRHKGQRIVIGPDVEVVVTEISRNGVKLGIVAPTSCTILRAEVRDSVERANREAALSQITDPDALLPIAESEQNAAAPRLSPTPNHVAPTVSHGYEKP